MWISYGGFSKQRIGSHRYGGFEVLKRTCINFTISTVKQCLGRVDIQPPSSISGKDVGVSLEP